MLDSVFENDDAQDNGIDWDVLGFWAEFFSFLKNGISEAEKLNFSIFKYTIRIILVFWLIESTSKA